MLEERILYMNQDKYTPSFRARWPLRAPSAAVFSLGWQLISFCPEAEIMILCTIQSARQREQDHGSHPAGEGDQSTEFSLDFHV